ncbi:pyridoxamine 5'-phosphate oxidase family protein [Radiobacillus sp. PE A8.2]|uniref:pyridoxamine 5'-phosphate oxidase family protein n=1 Tax=Radiobacillus sp. PE A8.2 TaxID=3380349 RepID=UPI00388F5DE8
MEQNEIIEKVDEILSKNSLGTLATVRDNKPFSRYMTFYNDDLHLYTATNKDTHKVEDLEENNHVHILLGYQGEGLKDQYIEIEGKAIIQDSEEVKQKIWKEELEPWFDGPNDPNYTVLEIAPTEIRLMNTADGQPEVLDF